MFVPKTDHAIIHQFRGSAMLLDYYECESVDCLVQVLNDIASSSFILEKVIPQPGETFVVFFRRHDFG